MGLSYSDLQNDSALSVIAKFIIVKESFDLWRSYYDENTEQNIKKRNGIISRLLIAGLVADVSNRFLRNKFIV